VLIVPGLGGSGSSHWQTRWEVTLPRAERVCQRDWDRPDRGAWVAAFGAALERGSEPAVVVAHSLGCAVVAHAVLAGAQARIRAALLVAPADVDATQFTHPQTASFAPMPLAPLPFAATVVASADDPFVSIDRARAFASAWRAPLVEVGRLGHINADSGLGDWKAGRALLDQLWARA
jgi:serine hydrolase